MDTIEKLKERALRYGNHMSDFYSNFLVDYCIERTESPIEAMLFYELMIRQFLNSVFSDAVKFSSQPQAQIKKYRVDFLVATDRKKVVVECDGHDFHEKTKEQAARDKKRDREIQRLGYQVMHFTGSEIYRNAKGVVLEIERTLDVSQVNKRAKPNY